MPRNQSTATTRFRYVTEQDDQFIALFPHRFDYIYARHPEPHQSPNWHTESRYPLSDRQLQQGEYLFGVRFGQQTQYCLLDIDADSPYHPQQDSWATDRLLAALEPLGLVGYVVCTSSDSGGLHIYFPFTVAKPSWELAAVVAMALQNSGFHLKPGWLELFPNPRPYLPQTTPSLFHAHRLPLQMGSYLLNHEFQPVWTDPQRFVQQWRLAQQQNQWNVRLWQRLLKQSQRDRGQISGKAEKFLNDLNTEIELGWTGYGQTNRLLGRIALRAYVFDHILQGSQPLSGEALVDRIVTVATQLPGYRQWCRHQHEIRQRAEEWARCVQGSRYFPYQSKYGVGNSRLAPNSHTQVHSRTVDAHESVSLSNQSLTWNQQQAEKTREKIRLAIADLLMKQLLPTTATVRYRALLSYGIGGASLYRHRDLWHPNYLHELTPFEHTKISSTFSGKLGKNCGHNTEVLTDRSRLSITGNFCTEFDNKYGVRQMVKPPSDKNSELSTSNLVLSSQSVESITLKITSNELDIKVDPGSESKKNQEAKTQFEINLKNHLQNHVTESDYKVGSFDCAVGASNGQDQTSLFPVIGGDVSSGLDFSDCVYPLLSDWDGDSGTHLVSSLHLYALDEQVLDSVPPLGAAYVHLDHLDQSCLDQTVSFDLVTVPLSSGGRGLLLARRIVQQLRQAIAASRATVNYHKAQWQAIQHQQATQTYLAQMRTYLASGDPILMAEARAVLGSRDVGIVGDG